MLKSSTILLVRHAEKPSSASGGPGLSSAGQRRAQAYVDYFKRFRASSVDGSIRFSGPINAGGTYHLESHDGDVILLTDGAPDAVMSISTFDGEFESDYPVTVTGANSNRRMTFTLGAGKARVELQTFDGKISLRRAPAR